MTPHLSSITFRITTDKGSYIITSALGGIKSEGIVKQTSPHPTISFHLKYPPIRLYRMDRLNAIKLLAVLTFVHATSGQTVTVSGPSRAAAATNVLLTCTVDAEGTSTSFNWIDDSTGQTIYQGSGRFSTDDKYLNFEVTLLSSTQSVMTIENAEVEDDGEYKCEIPTNSNTTDLVIEAPSNVTLTLNDTVTNNEDMYVATCDAVGGKPQETITWTLNGVPQTDGNGNTIVDTNPPATAPLSDSKSVFTFPATLENYRQTLVCQVSGHQIPELDGDISRVLNIHGAPNADIMTVEIQFLNPSYRVLCNINETDQPNPRIRNYYIYSGETLIHQSLTGVNFVDVSEYDPESDPESIVFNCVAGNYLGNATTFPPPSTTTLTPTTTAAVNGLTAGAYAGIAIGVIACIVIIVLIVLYLLKPECCPCFAGSGAKSSGSSKPAGSAVGSSNGSEREKTKPEAAPRGHGSIQHTNDNPNQDMYAMVDKKPSAGRGGDAPDRGSGPGQNEPQGMLYADLDLSHKAGHTDKHVPKNENDVVVYSSILV